ncbi:sulfotransferase family 2 domain-containing protein [Aestuariibius sp. 2305UL40-4]|uniref:sulfotransferase family 2 domain-containing protein n=1 Tax=Aestuariibius violaceus TaxID=3234132 RepID=UPI00345EDE25
MNRFSHFVMLAGMRTGSNLLENNLNRLADVTCHGELFNPNFIAYPHAESHLDFTREARDADPFFVLEAMKSQPGMNGFRLFDGHDESILDAVLADPACAKICLNRDPLESYVSRKIAVATGQWMMRDASKKKTASPVFDREEFEGYLTDLATFQSRIRSALQKTGQTAFYVDYGQLKDVEVLNGLFSWLGVDGRVEQVDEAIKKQNAKPLSETVENFDEMVATLAEMDAFGAHRVPFHEPRRAATVHTLVTAAKAPLAFIPIIGGPRGPVENWLASLDGVRIKDLGRRMTSEALNAWLAESPGRRSFAVLRHPVVRAHLAFRDKILQTGPGCYRGIRQSLIKRYDFALPEDGEAMVEDPEAYKPLFLRFLEFLEVNLAGQTAIRVDGFWASQGATLRGMADILFPDVLIREDELEEQLQRLARDVGITDAPAPRNVAPPYEDALDQIYDDEIEQAARKAYARDYLEFGFGDWR